MSEDILPLHIHLIAGFIDSPNIFMGGPSKRSIRKAEDIWAALIEEGIIKDEHRSS